VVIFDDRTTIGMVRLYAKETSAELAKVFNEMQGKKGTRPELSENFTELAQDKLDDIFKD
jgi:hypothetical protein